MLGRWLRWVLLVGVAALGAVAATHARPYDDSAIKLLLGTEICAAASGPCWMGIVVNETTSAEATARLRAHPWVGDVVRNGQHIIWTWNGQQPRTINAMQGGVIRLSSDLVRQIRIQTHIPLGSLWAAFQQPDDALLVRPISRTQAYQIITYNELRAQAISLVGCPTLPSAFWFSPVTFGMGEVYHTDAINSVPLDIYTGAHWWSALFHCRVPRADR